MKNLKLLLFGAIITLGAASCTNEGVTTILNPGGTPLPSPVPVPLTADIFYVDTAKIYSTSLTGTNRTLVTGIDTLNTNSYIGSSVLSPDANKIYFLHYNFSTTQTIKLYSVNKDGTALTVLKNMPAGGPEYVLLRATADKIIFYQAAFTPPSTFTNTLQSINIDGTNQATLAAIATGTPLITSVSSALNRYAAIDFTTPSNVQTGSISGSVIGAPVTVGPVIGSNGFSLSSDGSKIAYAKLNASSQIEIYVYDVATATSTLKFTHTVVAGIGTLSNYAVSVRWVDGSSKILLGYGKFTSPNGSASDFTHVSLYTLSTSAEVTWRILGDQITRFVTQ